MSTEQRDNNPKRVVTREVLLEFLDYREDTGILRWKRRDLRWFSDPAKGKSWNTLYANKIAGHVAKSHGYMKLNIFGKPYYAHRLIWLMVYGEWPEQIDHINGNRTDNSLANLRNVNNAENGKNTKLHNTNTSGLSGVYLNKVDGRWRSQIYKDQKTVYLGIHSDFFEACCSRKSAENRYGFHENHGTIR